MSGERMNDSENIVNVSMNGRMAIYAACRILVPYLNPKNMQGVSEKLAQSDDELEQVLAVELHRAITNLEQARKDFTMGKEVPYKRFVI